MGFQIQLISWVEGRRGKNCRFTFYFLDRLIGNIWSPLALILPLRSVCKRWCHSYENKALFFSPAVTWCRMMKPTKISSKNVFVHLMSSPCAPCFFWSSDSSAVMESSYFPRGMCALNKLHIRSHSVVDQDRNVCGSFNQAGWRRSGTDSKNIKVTLNGLCGKNGATVQLSGSP